MPTKNCLVEVYVRDTETNEIITVESGPGTTDDEGATVNIPAGYCSSIASAAPADICVTVYAPPDVNQPAAFLTRTEDTTDPENLRSILTFDLTP